MSDTASDDHGAKKDAPKVSFIESWKWWIVGACAIFLVVAIIIHYKKAESPDESQVQTKEQSSGVVGRPTRDNPIRVLLTNEWTEITQYSQIEGGWKIQFGKIDIELTTDKYDSNEYWNPIKEAKNLDAGQIIYGRTIEDGTEQRIAFFYE